MDSQCRGPAFPPMLLCVAAFSASDLLSIWCVAYLIPSHRFADASVPASSLRRFLVFPAGRFPDDVFRNFAPLRFPGRTSSPIDFAYAAETINLAKAVNIFIHYGDIPSLSLEYNRRHCPILSLSPDERGGGIITTRRNTSSHLRYMYP